MSQPIQSVSTNRLNNQWWLSVWAIAAAFGAYFCMYGFRKPFTAAAYEGLSWWGFAYKSVLVTAQVFGYMLSNLDALRRRSRICVAAAGFCLDAGANSSADRADSFGYLGYVAVMLARGAIRTDQNFLEFFLALSAAVTALAVVLLAGCWIYFARRTRKRDINNPNAMEATSFS